MILAPYIGAKAKRVAPLITLPKGVQLISREGTKQDQIMSYLNAYGRGTNADIASELGFGPYETSKLVYILMQKGKAKCIGREIVGGFSVKVFEPVRLAELVDASDLSFDGESCAGSTPAPDTSI